MSPVTRFLFGVGLALVLLTCSVDAHGWMTSPKPRGQYKTPARYEYEEFGPATLDPTDSAIVCRNDPVMPKANWLSLEAGKSQSISIQFNVLHVGDCAVYLTYDGDKPEREMKWFKIWQQHKCMNTNQYNIPIPSYLPSGEHVIFRWEWYALHAYPNVEYYTQCVDAKMTGSATGALPSPQVNIPGHLPKLSGDYQQKTNNYWWPWGGDIEKFTGPLLATLNGQPNPTDAPSNPTTAPTKAPTKAPTNAPTKAPTNPPKESTKAPTNAPTNPPKEPTKAPTSAPTKPPTNPTPTPRPTTRPPSGSTTKPLPTPPPTAPTSKPPSQSVKLSVANSASTWWFAATVVGHRASEVSSVQFKDSGRFSEFTPMINEWSDVWVFDPNPSGEITFPVTVKASLPSGTSLTFVVNSLSAKTVDSGAVFA